MNDLVKSENPFANSTAIARPSSNAASDAGQQRQIAEVQAAMTIAKRFPRDPVAAMDKILNACTRPSLADGALYSYSKGGTEITGSSIRLAETMAQNWGNMDFGIRELEQRQGESTVEAFAWDMETNTRQVKVFQVSHKRFTRNGSYNLEDPREIYELVANQGARRLRACILGIIPGDVEEAARRECERTLRANVDVTPEGLKKLVDAFTPYGVTQGQIEKRCQCRLEAIRPAQVIQLKKVWASIRDQMSSVTDWFEVEQPAGEPAGTGTQALKDKVASKVAAAADKKDPANADEAKPATDANEKNEGAK